MAQSPTVIELNRSTTHKVLPWVLGILAVLLLGVLFWTLRSSGREGEDQPFLSHTQNYVSSRSLPFAGGMLRLATDGVSRIEEREGELILRYHDQLDGQSLRIRAIPVRNPAENRVEAIAERFATSEAHLVHGDAKRASTRKIWICESEGIQAVEMIYQRPAPAGFLYYEVFTDLGQVIMHASYALPSAGAPDLADQIATTLAVARWHPGESLLANSQR